MDPSCPFFKTKIQDNKRNRQDVFVSGKAIFRKTLSEFYLFQHGKMNRSIENLFLLRDTLKLKSKNMNFPWVKKRNDFS